MFKEARRVCETIKGYKKRALSCGQTINISATILLGNTLRVLVTSYRLPWQDVRSTSRHSYFQLLLIIWKTKSVTYHFYFFVGKLQKSFNFSDSMTKSYLADFMKQRKKAFYGLQKIVLDSFSRNFSVRNAIMNDACKPKNDRYPDKIEMFSANFISGSCDFTTYFHFRGVTQATFDRNLMHSADTLFLVMARASLFHQKSRA